ncbi:MAG: hypothetical protein PHI12_08535 [Dehalococcoidales bacterium]|nr:hypothetical protein [Dehalococcoidales bacterium]
MARPLVVTGNTLNELQHQLEAWYKPGAKMHLYLGVQRDMTAEILADIQQSLLKGGVKLTSPLDIGNGKWPNTLRIQFEKGIGPLPLDSLTSKPLGWILINVNAVNARLGGNLR